MIAAKQAVADVLGLPLARLAPEVLAQLDAALAGSLRKSDVLDYARTHLKPLLGA